MGTRLLIDLTVRSCVQGRYLLMVEWIATPSNNASLKVGQINPTGLRGLIGARAEELPPAWNGMPDAVFNPLREVQNRSRVPCRWQSNIGNTPRSAWNLQSWPRTCSRDNR